MNNLYGKIEQCHMLSGGRHIDIFGDEHGNLTIKEGDTILWQNTVWFPTEFTIERKRESVIGFKDGKVRERYTYVCPLEREFENVYK